jgi:hypothetical protein
LTIRAGSFSCYICGICWIWSMQFEMGTSWRASSRSGSESGLTDVGPGWSRCLTSNETRETVVILWHDWSGLFFPRHVMEGMWYDRSSISGFVGTIALHLVLSAVHLRYGRDGRSRRERKGWSKSSEFGGASEESSMATSSFPLSGAVILGSSWLDLRFGVRWVILGEEDDGQNLGVEYGDSWPSAWLGVVHEGWRYWIQR